MWCGGGSIHGRTSSHQTSEVVRTVMPQNPSRWWKREHTLWPRWLAQRLCDHRDSYHAGFGHDTSTGTHTTLLRCSDCYKLSTIPTACKHPFKRWKVTAHELVDDERGGGTHSVPLAWYCSDCGYTFTKEMQCPDCHVNMEIAGWLGLFSGRFHCTICGVYYFREDLDGCKCKED